MGQYTESRVMEAPMTKALTGYDQIWPALPLEAWVDTCQTLQLWTQVVGKIRTALTPWVNHSWHVVLYVSERGLSTRLSPMRMASLLLNSTSSITCFRYARAVVLFTRSFFSRNLLPSSIATSYLLWRTLELRFASMRFRRSFQIQLPSARIKYKRIRWRIRASVLAHSSPGASCVFKIPYWLFG